MKAIVLFRSTLKSCPTLRFLILQIILIPTLWSNFFSIIAWQSLSWCFQIKSQQYWKPSLTMGSRNTLYWFSRAIFCRILFLTIVPGIIVYIFTWNQTTFLIRFTVHNIPLDLAPLHCQNALSAPATTNSFPTWCSICKSYVCSWKKQTLFLAAAERFARPLLALSTSGLWSVSANSGLP